MTNHEISRKLVERSATPRSGNQFSILVNVIKTVISFYTIEKIKTKSKFH